MAESIVKVPNISDAEYDYIAFTFKGKHSYEDFGIYRVSDNNNGYADNWTPTLKDSTADVPGMDGQYFLGALHKNKVFSIKIAFDSLTETQIQLAKAWLDGKDIGELWFSETPYKVYMAKVTGTSKIVFLPTQSKDGIRRYKGTGTIQFTCYHPYARTPKYISYNNMLLDGKNPESYVHFYNYDEIKESLPGATYMEGSTTNFYPTALGDLPTPFIAQLSRVGFNTITLHPNTNALSATGEKQEAITLELEERQANGEPQKINLKQKSDGTPWFTQKEAVITSWNTDPYGKGTTYTLTEISPRQGKLDLYAQWSVMKTIKFYKALVPYAKNYCDKFTKMDWDEHTGIQELYGCYVSVDGVRFDSLGTSYYRGKFSSTGVPDGYPDGTRNSLQVSIGTKLTVWTNYDTRYNDATCEIWYNGKKEASGRQASYTFEVTKDTNIVFEWCVEGLAYLGGRSYWKCFITNTKPNIEEGELKS